MYPLTYRTEILRKVNYRQTEGISFTDDEWVFYLLPECQTVVRLPFNIYQYWYQRPGQTLSPVATHTAFSNRSRTTILLRMLNAYIDNKVSDCLMRRNRIEKSCKIIYREQILFGKVEELEPLENLLKSHFPNIYEKLENEFQKFGPIKIYHVRYWRKHQKNVPFMKLLLNARILFYRLTKI